MTLYISTVLDGWAPYRPATDAEVLAHPAVAAAIEAARRAERARIVAYLRASCEPWDAPDTTEALTVAADNIERDTTP